MVKIFWYFISVTTVLFIMIHNPAGSVSNFMGSNQAFSFSGNQNIILRIIIFNIFLFFILTIMCVNLITNS